MSDGHHDETDPRAFITADNEGEFLHRYWQHTPDMIEGAVDALATYLKRPDLTDDQRSGAWVKLIAEYAQIAETVVAWAVAFRGRGDASPGLVRKLVHYRTSEIMDEWNVIERGGWTLDRLRLPTDEQQRLAFTCLMAELHPSEVVPDEWITEHIQNWSNIEINVERLHKTLEVTSRGAIYECYVKAKHGMPFVAIPPEHGCGVSFVKGHDLAVIGIKYSDTGLEKTVKVIGDCADMIRRFTMAAYAFDLGGVLYPVEDRGVATSSTRDDKLT